MSNVYIFKSRVVSSLEHTEPIQPSFFWSVISATRVHSDGPKRACALVSPSHEEIRKELKS